MFLIHIKCWSFCQTKLFEELHPSSKAWSLLWLLTNYICIGLSLTYSSHQNAIRYLFFVVKINLLLQLHYKNKTLFHRDCLCPQDLFFIFALPFFPTDLLKGLQPGAQHAATLSHSPLPAHLQQAYTGKDMIYFYYLFLT